MSLINKNKKNFQRTRFNTSLQIVRDNYGKDWRNTAKEIKKKDKCCAVCGATNNLQVHHIQPLSRGGRTSNLNLLTICHTCHKKRHKHMK